VSDKVGDRESKLQSVASTLANLIYICCLNIPHFRYGKHATVFAREFGPSMAGARNKGELWSCASYTLRLSIRLDLSVQV